MEKNKTEHNYNQEEPPPVFSSWNRLYLLVLVNLFILIGLFYAFTRTFE